MIRRPPRSTQSRRRQRQMCIRDRLYVMGRADGAGDDRGELVEVEVGDVLDLDGAGADELVDVGMVDGDLHAGAVLEEIATTVADVADQDLAAVDGGADEGGAHALVLGELAGVANGVVGGADGEGEADLDGGFEGLSGEGVDDGAAGDRAGDFAGCHASHTVANDVEVGDGVVAEVVLVVGANATNVAEGCNLNVRGQTGASGQWNRRGSAKADGCPP